MTDGKAATRAVPKWVPVDVRNYVFHTEMGQPIRALARSQACHASTIMRQIRNVESRRDDPLVDRAIKTLGQGEPTSQPHTQLEMMQALRRLAMPDTLLAIAMGMEQGVVLQENLNGDSDHGTKLPSTLAMTLALRGWIAGGRTTGKVLRYRITPSGRAALRDLVADSENHARAMAEAPTPFEGANGRGTWGEPHAVARMPVHESPVVALARRKGHDGRPFLSRPMVRAAERLREDFELAQIGQRSDDGPRPDWMALLASINEHSGVIPKEDSPLAQVTKALVFLGPGLAEVAMRCCCLLEGLETTEKHMGWAARSGKVVLRIALQRLVLHYDDHGDLGPKIG